MQAIKIRIDDHIFLFPDGFDFVFPDYVNEHIATIRQYIAAGKETIEAMKNYGKTDTTELQKRTRLLKTELAEFKARTGIIGFPFDSRDVDLYVKNNNIDVVAIYDFS
ncbi:hypothetical protein IM288_21795 [Enterobacter cloacae complex sp. P32C]|uniref:hypothetical protein n=1 Tax=Enterobacter cloacae complex sp. P32C TaxID=2779559 RepID=UPI00186873FB|nr:hypothetical protein [Enterobacter cloacae complex sp. P32C]MBE3211088.1 hypothetical protein [Enterobacter cloacae complex sp. P32C]